MGASPGSIMKIFMVQGASVGLLGTAIGMVLGVLLALNVGLIAKYIGDDKGNIAAGSDRHSRAAGRQNIARNRPPMITAYRRAARQAAGRAQHDGKPHHR